MSDWAAGAPAEGVVRYRLRHRLGLRLPRMRFAQNDDGGARVAAIYAALQADGLIGRDPARYGGAAYGNVSFRLDARGRFAISGTQTSGVPGFDPARFAVVVRCWPAENRLWSFGPVPPSSESMTHAAVYAAHPRIAAVVHAHDPALWRAGLAHGGWRTTPADVDYGTPAMAAAVAAAVAAGDETDALLMAGHEDGVIAYGPTFDAAAAHLRAVRRQLVHDAGVR
ncbi:MAG: class II aldolase/adducin family protein [Acidobacteriota bacterium]